MPKTERHQTTTVNSSVPEWVETDPKLTLALAVGGVAFTALAALAGVVGVG